MPLSVIIYNIFLGLFRIGTAVGSLFNPKIKKWVVGRRQIFDKLQAAIPSHAKIIWMHCASVGEFEQGRPIIERLKTLYPEYKILLTFFSPSGYEATQNYKGADWIFYMPLDGSIRSKRFLEIIQPRLVIFVKYEFWFYYLKKIKYRNIPLILVSAIFTDKMSFFKWYGQLQRKMLTRFDQVFVQNENSKKLLDAIGLSAITTVAGDTRFDRVLQIASKWEPLPKIDFFIGDCKTIVAGSTWPEDEELLCNYLSGHKENNIKLILAPHEIDEKHLEGLRKLFPAAVFYSEFTEDPNVQSKANCLIIDNIGMLSRLYKYGTINYVGGGLRPSGIHNVLEAAVYGKPVLFGPVYKKYAEAIALIEMNGSKSFAEAREFETLANQLLEHETIAFDMGKQAAQYVTAQAGATKVITGYIQENLLFTN